MTPAPPRDAGVRGLVLCAAVLLAAMSAMLWLAVAVSHRPDRMRFVVLAPFLPVPAALVFLAQRRSHGTRMALQSLCVAAAWLGFCLLLRAPLPETWKLIGATACAMGVALPLRAARQEAARPRLGAGWSEDAVIGPDSERPQAGGRRLSPTWTIVTGGWFALGALGLLWSGLNGPSTTGFGAVIEIFGWVGLILAPLPYLVVAARSVWADLRRTHDPVPSERSAFSGKAKARDN